LNKSDLATGRQLHTIALLCMACGVHAPLEEQPMTMGEAGILIRRLSNERVTLRKNAHPNKGG